MFENIYQFMIFCSYYVVIQHRRNKTQLFDVYSLLCIILSNFFFKFTHRIQPIKRIVRLKKIGPWKNVKEYVLVSVHQIFFLDDKVTV